MKSKVINNNNLKDLNNFAHSDKFLKKLKSFNSEYENFEIFLDDFEKYIETQIDTPSLKLNSQDKIFEGIINRLDVLSYYKKIAIRVYLETQKLPESSNHYQNTYSKNAFVMKCL